MRQLTGEIAVDNHVFMARLLADGLNPGLTRMLEYRQPRLARLDWRRPLEHPADSGSENIGGLRFIADRTRTLHQSWMSSCLVRLCVLGRQFVATGDMGNSIASIAALLSAAGSRVPQQEAKGRNRRATGKPFAPASLGRPVSSGNRLEVEPHDIGVVAVLREPLQQQRLVPRNDMVRPVR